MLGNDLIRDVILFMHLDIQPVVLHAEGSFGYRIIAGIRCLEIGDMNSTSDADFFTRVETMISALRKSATPKATTEKRTQRVILTDFFIA